ERAGTLPDAAPGTGRGLNRVFEVGDAASPGQEDALWVIVCRVGGTSGGARRGARDDRARGIPRGETQMSTPLRCGSAAVALAAPLLGVRVGYAFPPPVASIYDGSQASGAGFELKGWGSGQASEDRTKGYAGQPTSIKVKSDGYYSGGR